jgi:hypothetical protein
MDRAPAVFRCMARDLTFLQGFRDAMQEAFSEDFDPSVRG